jgi:cyclic pyranopterin phosphate synthase
MPEEGINFTAKSRLLSYEEMERLVRILADMGIEKVRITGGEPLVRKDVVPFMKRLSEIDNIRKVSITTNGTYVEKFLPEFQQMNLEAINLSLDTLDKERFFQITRRNEFDEVMANYRKILDSGIKTKINMVVMQEHNLADIIPMCELTREDDVSVRFIEEMPFNGGNKLYQPIEWNTQKILDHIKTKYPNLEKLEDESGSTSYNYRIPGHKGSFGLIPAYTRTICGQCDRIRITPQGVLKTCLYDNGRMNFRDMMRAGATDDDLRGEFLKAFKSREINGFEAEKQAKNSSNSFESMATIGG